MVVFDQNKSSSLLDEMRKDCQQESARLEVELQGKNDQSTKDQNLKKGFEKYMRDENKKLSGYKENVQIYGNISKKYVSEFNVRKLKSLASKSHINNLFRYLFCLLYDKSESEYDAKKFAKIALNEDADDFQIKLASFNTSKFHLKPETAEQFKRVKDQEFPESVTNQDLNNLLNWMDYIYEMYLAELEFKQQQQNLKANESEFSDRLLRISRDEEDNTRKRQVLNLYRAAQQQIDTNYGLLKQKQTLASRGSNNLDLSKPEFFGNLERFMKELYEIPNHL